MRNEDKKKDAAKLRAMLFFEQGRHYYHARKFDNALQSFEKAIEADPGFTRAYTSKAQTLVSLKQADKVLEVCDLACQADPQSPYPHMSRAVVLTSLGRMSEADEEYRRALALEPDNDIVNYNYACFWATRGDEDKCREYLTKALRLQPKTHTVAAVDEDFAPYRDREWFQNLVAFRRD